MKILRDEPYFSVFQRTERVLEVLRGWFDECDWDGGELDPELAELALRVDFAKNRLRELEPDY